MGCVARAGHGGREHRAGELSTEKSLALSCSLLHSCWSARSATRHRRAVAASSRSIELLEDYPLPAAVFGRRQRHAADDEQGVAFVVSRVRRVSTRRRRRDRGRAEDADPAAPLRARGPLPSRTAYFGATLQPLRGALGAITNVIVVCTEVTDEVFARQLGVDSSALIWGGTVAGSPTYYNACWRATLGDVSWRSAVHPDDVPRWMAGVGEAVRQRESAEVEVRLRRIDGAHRWHRVRFAAGRSGLWLGCAIDVHEEHNLETERLELLAQARAARADAEQANRLKDQFLAAVSHELRAPLTTMLLWEKVLRENIDEESRTRALDAIHHSAVVQSRLVGDLLDVSRCITGKLYLDIRIIDAERLVSDAIDAARPAALVKSISLARISARSIADVYGDVNRLRQVLDNLISNAIKFTPAGGHVRVVLEVRGDSIALEIIDSGRGIAPEFLGRIFEPFSQLDDALTRREGGLGLGLAISKQIVELHGGTLTASSGGHGAGSTFTVTLPLETPTRTATPPAGYQRVRRLDGTRVLVVDDDERVREALVLLLEASGAEVECAESAASARIRIAAVPPEIMICDIAMPAEDGYSFLGRLRAEGIRIPSLALTAYATEADARRALAAGFDRHLAKPVSFERLVETVSELLATGSP